MIVSGGQDGLSTKGKCGHFGLLKAKRIVNKGLNWKYTPSTWLTSVLFVTVSDCPQTTNKFPTFYVDRMTESKTMPEEILPIKDTN